HYNLSCQERQYATTYWPFLFLRKLQLVCECKGLLFKAETVGNKEDYPFMKKYNTSFRKDKI
ncbi:hypothetical protein, partial [Neisseria perflava]|uniref:hypothetical protein n=1 Tax=Neisseria perflava TaxID=33053 RepID=UPI00209F4D91